MALKNMNHTKVKLREEDVLKLILEFFASRTFHVSMRTLEKESGVINSNYTEDILFLRELILDGDWDEVLSFAQPFEGVEGFNSKQFTYLILKQKFLELLSMKSHIVGKQTNNAVEGVIKTLSLLEKNCPSKEEYSNLCWLLTVPNLTERTEYKDWTLDNSRLLCFEGVLEIIGKILPLKKKRKTNRLVAGKDRLIQLIVKGLFYETCIEHCQSVATGNIATVNHNFSLKTNVLQGIADDYSANLLSWVKSLDLDAFSQPFEQVSVEIAVEKSKRPELATQSVDIPKTNKPKTTDTNTVFRSLMNFTSEGQVRNLVSDTHFCNGDSRSANTVSESETAAKNGKTDEIDKKMSKLASLQTKQSQNLGKIENGIMSDGFPLDDKASKKKEMFDDGQNHELKKAEPCINKPNNSSISLQDLKDEQRATVMQRLEDHENLRKKMEQELHLEVEFYHNGLQRTSEGAKDKETEPKFKDTDKFELNARYKEETAKEKFKPNGIDVKNANHLLSYAGGHNAQQPDIIGPEDSDLVKPKIENVLARTLTRHNVPYSDKPSSQQKSSSKSNSDGIVNNEPQSPQPQNEVPHPQFFTPKSVGAHVVNLADGSGTLNTSTPKPAKRGVTETPPPEASPVRPPPGSRPARASGIPSRALVKETVPNSTPKAIKVVEENVRVEALKPVLDPGVQIDQGKENVQSIQSTAPARQGPKINGRRLLAQSGSPQQTMPVLNASPQPVSPKVEEQVVAPKVNAPKGNDLPKSPDLKRSPISTKETSTQNRGPGPKIRMRDGSKVLVTELLRSREEIKNASAKVAKSEPKQNQITEELTRQTSSAELDGSPVLKFSPVSMLEDVQAVRAVSFHPGGKLFAVGSNSKVLRICSISSLDPIVDEAGTCLMQPSILFKRNKYHRGSIYCVSWNPQGQIIASGSNDKSIKILHFDPDNYIQEGVETELNIHSGTVRELAFVPNRNAQLISGGAGDGCIKITDCETGQTTGTLRGHSGNVMAVYAGEGDLVASGSADNTLRLWDLRSQRCIDVVVVGDSSPASVALSKDGSYLASGQEDGCILLYDLSAGRTLQSFRLHHEDCRSVRFSSDSKYLLTGSYDMNMSLMHIEGNLELTVPKHYTIASHKDKVIQCRWHPSHYAFLSSSADRTAILWSCNQRNNFSAS